MLRIAIGRRSKPQFASESAWFSSRQAFDGGFQFLPAHSPTLCYSLEVIRRPLLQSFYCELRHARLRRLHILQTNNVRTGVMSHRINDGLPDFDHVSLALSVKDLVARCRRNQGNAEWRNNLAAPMRVIKVHGLAQWKVWRQITRGHIAAGREDKCSGFHRMRTRQRMAPEKLAFKIRLFQLRTDMKGERSGKDCDVKVLSLLNHASANERHKMFAANETPNAADIGLVSDQVGAVFRSPNRPLDEGRHGLAMATQDLPCPFDEQQSVVNGVNPSP